MIARAEEWTEQYRRQEGSSSHLSGEALMRIIFTTGTLILGAACASGLAGTSLTDNAMEACLAVHGQWNSAFDEAAVERIYVLNAESDLEVALVRGEIGSFGIKTKDYRPMYVCLAKADPHGKPEVKIVSTNPWLEAAGIEGVLESGVSVLERYGQRDIRVALYLPGADGFVFIREKALDEAWYTDPNSDWDPILR